MPEAGVTSYRRVDESRMTSRLVSSSPKRTLTATRISSGDQSRPQIVPRVAENELPIGSVGAGQPLLVAHWFARRHDQREPVPRREHPTRAFAFLQDRCGLPSPRVDDVERRRAPGEPDEESPAVGRPSRILRRASVDADEPPAPNRDADYGDVVVPDAGLAAYEQAALVGRPLDGPFGKMARGQPPQRPSIERRDVDGAAELLLSARRNRECDSPPASGGATPPRSRIGRAARGGSAIAGQACPATARVRRGGRRSPARSQQAPTLPSSAP